MKKNQKQKSSSYMLYQLNPLLEKHNILNFKKIRSSNVVLPSVFSGSAGSILGLGAGEISGRIASKNEEDKEKKKKIRNKHRLIGAELGFASGSIPVYLINAKSILNSSKSMIRKYIDDIKSCINEINKNRIHKEKLKSTYKELVSEYELVANGPYSKALKQCNNDIRKFKEILGIDLKAPMSANASEAFDIYKHNPRRISEYESFIKNTDERIAYLKSNINDIKDKLNKYITLKRG